MEFGIVQSGCWVFGFCIVGCSGLEFGFFDFVIFFVARWGKPFQTPLRYTFFGCFVGLDFRFVQCEIWSLDLGLLDFGFFCLENGPGIGSDTCGVKNVVPGGKFFFWQKKIIQKKPTMTNDQYAAQLDFQTMFFGVVFFNMFCG